MAKKHVAEEDQTLNALNNTLTATGETILKNRKAIGVALGVLIVVALGIMAYIFMYSNPRAEKAMEAFNNVATTATNDTTAAKAYQDVANQHSGTTAANLANLAAAEHYYEIGKFQEAINSLEKFSTSEVVMMSQAYCLKGDCFVNLKQYDKAIQAFDKAISTAGDNDASTPRFLDKKATVYDAQKQYAKALECYETIKKDYPNYENGSYPVDAYIAREKARLGK